MDLHKLILTELRHYSREVTLEPWWGGFTWDDATFVRTLLIRLEHGDPSAWDDFVHRLRTRRRFAWGVAEGLQDAGYLDSDYECSPFSWRIRPLPAWMTNKITLSFPYGTACDPEELETLRECLFEAVNDRKPDRTPPVRTRESRSAIMYLEYKGDHITGPARIGRVTLSKSRKTIYYQDCVFQSLKGKAHLANYVDVENGGLYWISRCREDGFDTLYPATVEIDEDVRGEYWTEIRNRPDLVAQSSFRSEGKYTLRSVAADSNSRPHRRG